MLLVIQRIQLWVVTDQSLKYLSIKRIQEHKISLDQIAEVQKIALHQSSDDHTNGETIQATH